MKMIWESRQVAQQAVTGRKHIVAWDFLKMLAAAVLCGLAVSIAAAGIALLLTSSAEARLFQKEPVTAASNSIAHTSEVDELEIDDLSPAPGALLLGDGCERTSLNAIERDWQVRIDGKRVEVRVMQTFQLPVEPTDVATFHVQLIKGARMQSLAAQSSTKEWAGHMISADEYDRLTPAEYLSRTRSRLIVAHSPRGTVTTSPFLGLKSEDLINIEYTYVMNLDAAGGKSTFILPLEASDDYVGIGRPSADHDGAFPLSRKSTTTRGAVWVEWIGSKPRRVMGLPVDADLEFSKSLIEGFSWSTREIHPGARFQLDWAL